MNDTAKIAIAGGIVVAVAAMSHHHRQAHHGAHRHHARGPHGCGGHPHSHTVGGPQWQGLTEDEARTKLANRLRDPAAVDAVIDELDTRGYLARS